MKRFLVVAAVVLSANSLAVAEEVIVQPETKPFTVLRWWQERQAQQHDNLPIPGDSTESWLAMQREGNMASENPQAATRELREKAAERFLKTYDFPIPENVYGTDFKAGK